jgi:glycosyltransferase involved in cell wall biosynthesis
MFTVLRKFAISSLKCGFNEFVRKGITCPLVRIKTTELHLIIAFCSKEVAMFNILIVGTIRNGSKTINRDIRKIITALEPIGEISVFVVESDSTDDTVEFLRKYSENDARVRYVSLGNLRLEIPDRIERLRYCRNRYVDEIRNNPIYAQCELIIIADLDGINTKLETNRIKIALAFDGKWDVLTANQKGPYYDILALRHSIWSPNNCEIESKWYEQFYSRDKAWDRSTLKKMIQIPENMEPIEVDSAFGGFAMYKRWVLERCDYTKDSDIADSEIDHVTLHRKAKLHGANIYIHPFLINSGFTPHSLESLTLVRFLKSLARKIKFRV